MKKEELQKEVASLQKKYKKVKKQRKNNDEDESTLFSALSKLQKIQDINPENESQQMTDVESAINKAAKIRAEGRLKYNLKLLKELEADKSRKLMVVNVLMVGCLVLVFITYSLYEAALNRNLLDEFIKKLLMWFF